MPLCCTHTHKLSFRGNFSLSFMTILLTLGLTGGGSGNSAVVPFAASGSGGGSKNQQQQRPVEREKDLTGNLELGELGQLTITNDNESSYDVILIKQMIDACILLLLSKVSFLANYNT